MNAGLIVPGCITPDCDGIGTNTINNKEFCKICYDIIIKSKHITEEEVTVKVK